MLVNKARKLVIGVLYCIFMVSLLMLHIICMYIVGDYVSNVKAIHIIDIDNIPITCLMPLKSYFQLLDTMGRSTHQQGLNCTCTMPSYLME